MYVREVVNANNRGVPVVSNVTRDPNWGFGQALFFTGTVLTTIGMYKRRKGGKGEGRERSREGGNEGKEGS